MLEKGDVFEFTEIDLEKLEAWTKRHYGDRARIYIDPKMMVVGRRYLVIEWGNTAGYDDGTTGNTVHWIAYTELPPGDPEEIRENIGYQKLPWKSVWYGRSGGYDGVEGVNVKKVGKMIQVWKKHVD